MRIAKIIGTTEKQTFNGLLLGFVLNTKNEAGENDVYYPFFQSLVQKDAVGKRLFISNENGRKTESVK
jgi:hypothetical protein